MKLAIRLISTGGKAFVEDLVDGYMYHMRHRGGGLGEAYGEDYLRVNRNGIPYDPFLYKNRRFKTLENAEEFIRRFTLQHEIQTLKKYQQTRMIKEILIDLEEESEKNKEKENGI